MQFQRCPNCRERNDVSVYVHGQLARCGRCGLRFAVDREAFSNPERNSSRPPLTSREAPAAQAMPRTEAPSGAPEPPVVPPRKSPAAISSGQIFLTPAERPKAAPGEARPAPPPPPPKVEGPVIRPSIPGYDLLDLLGRGGMGEVWRARQHSLNRVVAIKVLSASLAVEPDFVRRFERESAALAALAHPNIVTIYDRGAAHGVWYFVMEFVEGKSLRERAAEAKPVRGELLRLMAQVARAVEHAHKRGVIHRDLKPENVLLDHAGNTKVADFGLAGMSEVGRSSLTMTAVAMGTAHYMAPEQRRDAKNVDGRADIYSLGVMLYEMLCGEIPAGKFPSPREKVPDLDPRLDAVIMRMLEQDPERRPSRAAEIAEAIEASIETPPRALAAMPPPPIRGQSRPLQSLVRELRAAPGKQALFAGAIVLLIIAIGVAIARAGGSSDKLLAARVDRLPATHAATLLFGDGPADTVLASEGWDVLGGDLLRSAGRADAKTDHAWIQPVKLEMDTVGVEADAVLTGAEAQSGFAGVGLQKGDRQVSFGTNGGGATTLVVRDGTGHELATFEGPRVGDGKHHLTLMIGNGKATATVDRKVLQGAVGGTPGPWRAGFECAIGKCRFSGVRLTGLGDGALTTVQKG